MGAAYVSAGDGHSVAPFYSRKWLLGNRSPQKNGTMFPLKNQHLVFFCTYFTTVKNHLAIVFYSKIRNKTPRTFQDLDASETTFCAAATCAGGDGGDFADGGACCPDTPTCPAAVGGVTVRQFTHS